MGRGLLAVDLDRDGWVDLVKRDLNGPSTVHWARCGDAVWLEVSLRQGGFNRNAVGARVEVEALGHHHVRSIRAGGTSFASAGPPYAHTGLGRATHVDRVQVTWPDGERSVLVDLDVNQHITITRGQR